MPLSRRQQETLDWIRAYVKAHGKPPIMREISERFGTAPDAARGKGRALHVELRRG
jgi:SOS-response transcriptional repressor LexA